MNDLFSKEIPTMFALSMSQNIVAMSCYSNLDFERQKDIHSYIQNSATAYDAKRRIDACIMNLERYNTEFFDNIKDD
ncbi:MAG: hypothetical protein RSB87_02340 [Clostridia bacterium]